MLLNNPWWFPQWQQFVHNFPQIPAFAMTISEFFFFFSNPRLAFSSEHYLGDLTATPLILHTPEAVTSLPPSQELNTQ